MDVRITSSYLTPYKKGVLERKVGSCLKVMKSSIPKAGKGVIALTDIPRGFQLPYQGKVYKGKWDDITPLIDDFTYVYHDEEKGYVVDAHPRYNHTLYNVGFRVNEPPKGGKPNASFKDSRGWASMISPVSIVTTRPLKAGDEVWVSYGDVYDRSGYRN
jgi:hypothetical protein